MLICLDNKIILLYGHRFYLLHLDCKFTSKKKQYGLLLALLIVVNIYFAPEKIRHTEFLEFSREKGDLIVGIASSRQPVHVGRGKNDSAMLLHVMDFRINNKRWECICYLYPCTTDLDKSTLARGRPTKDFRHSPVLEKINIVAINRNKCFVLSMHKSGEEFVVHDLDETIQRIKSETHFKDPRRGMWCAFFSSMIIYGIFVKAVNQFRDYLKRRKAANQ